MKKIFLLFLFIAGSAVLLFALDALTILPNGLVEIGENLAKPGVSKDTKLNVHGRIRDATGLVMPVGSIIPYGGTTAPDGWLLCNGDAVNRGDYDALYDVIGTSFGIGDNVSTFNLPDLRGMFLRGSGTNGGAVKKVNNGSYTGPAVGVIATEKMHRHRHIEGIPENQNEYPYPWGVTYIESTTWGPGGNQIQSNLRPHTSDPISAGADGAPRVGDETASVNIGVNYIIKF